jgi:hypothetical protein
MHALDLTYRERVMGALVLVLALALLVVRGWPGGGSSAPAELFRDRPDDRIQIREIQPTSQSQEKNPPPPAPLPPVVVPDEVLVKEELDFGESALRVETPEDDARLQDGADRAPTARQPDSGARLLKNVQPTYPAAARDDEVRARIQVEVEIGTTGRVQSATVRRRWRLHEDGSAEPVDQLGYGLEEAALAAAERSLFRPATSGGTPVVSRKVLTFTFGRE